MSENLENLEKRVENEIDQFIAQVWPEVINEIRTAQEKIYLAATYFLDTLKEVKQIKKDAEDKYKSYLYLHKREEELNVEELAEYKNLLETKNTYSGDALRDKSSKLFQALEKTYLSAFAFQKIVNEAIGQKIQMVFVKNGQQMGIYMFELGTSYLRYDYTKDGNLVAKYRAIQNNNITLSNSKKYNFSLSGLNQTYQEALERFKIARSKNHYVVLWKIRHVWDGIHVHDAGTISEAYGTFILRNSHEPPFNKSLEQNLSDFFLNSHVDSVSGIFRGDYSEEIENNDSSYKNIEYAIKFAGSSTLGLAQLENLANEIEVKKGLYSIEDLQKKKEELNKTGTKNKIVKATVKELYDKNYEELKKIIKKRVDNTIHI